jgi:hypothetical protein
MDELRINADSTQFERRAKPRDVRRRHAINLKVHCLAFDVKGVAYGVDTLSPQPLVSSFGPVAARDDDRTAAKFCLGRREKIVDSHIYGPDLFRVDVSHQPIELGESVPIGGVMPPERHVVGYLAGRGPNEGELTN